MFIKRAEYERLKSVEVLNAELESEIKRLAELISAEVKDCQIGPWCHDCQHIGRDRAVVTKYDSLLGLRFVKAHGGEVQYCKKRLHEMCPKFERH